MPATPTGIRTLPLYRMALLIAASATFRTITGAGSEAAALDYIHYPEADDATATIPRCIITAGPDFSQERVGHGMYRTTGSNLVFFEFQEYDSAATLKDQYTTFLNQVGAILDECCTVAGMGSAPDGVSYLNVTGWQSFMMPERCEPQHENGAFYFSDGYLARYVG